MLVVNMSLLAGLLFLLLRPFPAPHDAGAGEPSSQSAVGHQESSDTAFSHGYAPVPTVEDYEALAASDLFGIGRSDTQSAEVDEVERAEEEYTPPPLQLLATVAGRGPIARAVVLNPDGGGEQRLKVGDTIAGATVQRIGPRSITLARDDQLYEIGMDFTGETGASGRGRPEESARAVTVETLIIGRGGEVTHSSTAEASEAPARAARGRWAEMDADERREAMRRRYERALENADPETRRRIEERIQRAGERMQER